MSVCFFLMFGLLLILLTEIYEILKKISRSLDGIYHNPNFNPRKIADDINFSANLRHEKMIEHICHIKAILLTEDKANGHTSKE